MFLAGKFLNSTRQNCKTEVNYEWSQSKKAPRETRGAFFMDEGPISERFAVFLISMLSW
jgi:hypothetical protein